MTKKEPLTLEGKTKIQTELDQLVKIDREEIKLKIQEARELGDLKENAEYHAAKEKQGHIEGRILKLQGILSNCEVVQFKRENIPSNIVFAATVTLFDPEKDTTLSYKIVGHEESNKSEGKISYKSPLAKALLGKEEGDTIIVHAPKGEIEYEVEKVEYK
jgi:transcription elongation factor GreA